MRAAKTDEVRHAIPGRNRSLIIPREHGAWGILLIPLFTGACAGLLDGGRSEGLAPFTMAALCLFWLRTPVENPALHCVRCGLDMITATGRLTPFWKVRVGVHVGPVIAGVVGHRKYQYDVWGDTVNLAARMEAAARALDEAASAYSVNVPISIIGESFQRWQREFDTAKAIYKRD